MSATTTKAKPAAHDAARAKAHDAPPPAASAPTAPTAPATQPLELDGITVELPIRFTTGHVLTSVEAAVLDAAYRRQFKNNQNANIKARSERLAKATTESDKAANAPWTAAQIASVYADYHPAVGDTPRQGSAEKMEYDARWNAYVAAVAEHNANVAKGLPGIFKSAGPVKIASAPALKKDASDAEKAAHKDAVATFMEGRKAFLEKFSTMAAYAPRVEAERAKLRAASGKNAKVEATVAGEDIL